MTNASCVFELGDGSEGVGIGARHDIEQVVDEERRSQVMEQAARVLGNFTVRAPGVADHDRTGRGIGERLAKVGHRRENRGRAQLLQDGGRFRRRFRAYAAISPTR